MTSHLNVDWEGTRYLNRREYNTNTKWNLTHGKEGHMVQNVYGKLLRPDGGIGGKYEGDALVSPAEALRKDLHRRQVGVAANQRARGQPLQSQEDSGTFQRSSASSLPTLASPTKKDGRHTAESERDNDNNNTDTTSTMNATSTRHHVHRRHKKNCPKHLLNEMRRREEAEALGLHPLPYSQVLDGPDAVPLTKGVKSANEIKYKHESNVDKLIKETSFMVGRSMAHVFTGSYDPSVNVREHRMKTEHPDFGKEAAKIDRMAARYQRAAEAQLAATSTKKRGDHNNAEQTSFSSPTTTEDGQQRQRSTQYGGRPFDYDKSTHQTLRLIDPIRGGDNNNNKNGTMDADTQKQLQNTQKLLDSYRHSSPTGATTRKEGPHRHLTHTKIIPEKTVAPPMDFDHFRRKYDLKSHMEEMQSMGPGLLREFANGKGFK